MITSTIHVLIITPVIFYIMKRRALRKGTLTVSAMQVESDCPMTLVEDRTGRAFGLILARVVGCLSI